MTYSKNDLRSLFQAPFSSEAWQQFLRDFIGAQHLYKNPQGREFGDTIEYALGSWDTEDHYKVGLFRYELPTGTVDHKKVGLRQLVNAYIKYEFDAALVVFNDTHGHWRLSFICNLKGQQTAPKRFTYLFGDANNQYHTPVERFAALQGKVNFASLKNAFSVEALTKQFYMELFNWYQWAYEPEHGIRFSKAEKNKEDIEIKLIRLITRLVFVWFIKQKNLVPAEIFDPVKLRGILKEFDPQSATQGNYYNAILQNLFFATLNRAIEDEKGNRRSFAKGKDMKHKTLYRHGSNDEDGGLFAISNDEVIKLFAQVPFLNGGLFECLDKTKRMDGKSEAVYEDGFSRKTGIRAFVPNVLFFDEERGLLSIFARYNFTIEENSPAEQQVALDPELLGRIFENLLGAYNPETKESARKQSGSFYTPREIVDYMIDESLIAHLLRHHPGCETQIRALFNDDFCRDPQQQAFYNRVHDDLLAVKILDPACGSGAFPVGCLLRIVHILQKIAATPVDPYQLKLRLIERCLFGGDIQPIAVQITKLRFFISLICDCRKVADAPNFGIPTLPNLEANFVAANSLLTLQFPTERGELDMSDPILKGLKTKLKDVRHQHFSAKTVSKKIKLREKDKNLRSQIKEHIGKILSYAPKTNHQLIENYRNHIVELESQNERLADPCYLPITQTFKQTELFGDTTQQHEPQLGIDLNKIEIEKNNKKIKTFIKKIEQEQKKANIQYNSQIDTAYQQLEAWDPYDQNGCATFFDPSWMFNVDDGFDIVIGNPPYIQLQNNGGALGNLYQPCGYKTFSKSGDIYCLFYERGWQLLKDDGIVCYITSNKWMRSGYGEATRAFFANNTNPQLLIDFAGVKVFESAVVDTNILLFSKAPNEGNTRCMVMQKQDQNCLDQLSLFVQPPRITRAPFTTSDSWVILSPIERSIKEKIEKLGTPLKDWDVQIYRGVLTGRNEAFIITTEKRNELLAACQTDSERERTAELIRPILRGRDIKRYGYNWAGLWLIATFPSRHYNIDDYPSVKNYLLSNFGMERLEQTGATHIIDGKPVKARKKTNNKWFETQDSISYWEDFEKPKITWNRIASEKLFAFVDEGIVISDSMHFIIGKYLDFLNSILNSKLFVFLMNKIVGEAAGGNAANSGNIRDLNVFVPTDEEYQYIINLLQQKAYAKIDIFLYKRYNLTADEIKYVLKQS